MKRFRMSILISTGALVALVLMFFVYERNQQNVTSSAPRSSSLVQLQIYPNTYTSLQPFMEGIYAADHQIKSPSAEDRIRAVIIPHHLLASTSIASGIKMLEYQKFKHILLISPDHFRKCQTVLCTIASSYQTFFGNVEASSQKVQTLLASSLVSENSDLFKTEHGIFADVPFIAHYFPGVSVTPLAISQVLPWKVQRTEIRNLINSVLDDETILIVSSDFSHYLPLTIADRMDEQTEGALLTKNFAQLVSLKIPDQSDCANCLWTLAAIADLRGFYHPQIISHTNSARILKDENVMQTTSHFSIVWSEKP